MSSEAVSRFVISGTIFGGKQLRIEGEATPTSPMFDRALSLYTSKPVALSDLFVLTATPNNTKLNVELTFTYQLFFDILLEHIIQKGGSLHNLASPADEQRVLDTFEYKNNKSKIEITYKTSTETIKSLPCKLVDFEVKKPTNASGLPAIKLVFELDFLSNIDATKRECMRKLIAMDWSEYLSSKKRTGKPEKTWEANCIAYIANNCDLSCGDKIRQELSKRHIGKSAEKIASDLRDDIDRFLITANHWGQRRESMSKERTQRLLSDLFGSIHQSFFFASPVDFIRDYRKSNNISVDGTSDEYVNLILQFGTAHCGEHSFVSFNILRELIKGRNTPTITHVVHTGNANIDHAFVFFNLDVKEVIHTITTAANNSVTKGKPEPKKLWNLRKTIADNPGKIGFVMDPYLDRSEIPAKAVDLLVNLNNKIKKSKNKDTDFLFFGLEHPPGSKVKDIRGLSENERKKLVKNV